MASTRDVLACTTKEYSETLSRSESLRVPTPRRECQCSTCTETPTQQSATTQDQHHAQGLALCHDVTLDIVTHRWVPAGHPQYIGAREGRLWVAQAQTQLTLFVDPQSLSLECEHGSGARRFEVQLGPRTQPELVHQRTQDSAVKPRRVADARVTLNPTRRRRPC